MKRYGDEDFIYLMNNMEDEDDEIETDLVRIPLGRNEVVCKEIVVSDFKFTMLLPKDFQEMEKEKAKLKYPSEFRPQVILTNKEGTINLTFSRQNELLFDEQVEELRDAIKDIIMKDYNNTAIIESDIIKIEEKPVAYFDFISNAIDSNVYNVIFVFSLKFRVLQGAFNCLEEDMEYWKEVFKQMISTIKII